MGHATETGAVPVYFAGFFVESAFLGGFFFGFFQLSGVDGGGCGLGG